MRRPPNPRRSALESVCPFSQPLREYFNQFTTDF
jgi:hypothetical protein